MGADPYPFQPRLLCQSLQDPLDVPPVKPCSILRAKEGREGGSVPPHLDPPCEGFLGGAPEVNDPFFPSLSFADEDLAGEEVHVAHVEGDKLLQPKAAVEEDEDHRLVPEAREGAGITGAEESSHLIRREDPGELPGDLGERQAVHGIFLDQALPEEEVEKGSDRAKLDAHRGRFQVSLKEVGREALHVCP